MKKLSGSCHCGAVRIEVPRKPRQITACNCSICRRYGTLWAYYKLAEVRRSDDAGTTADYAWGDKTLRFVRCAACGCVVSWEPLDPGPQSRCGVNMRNFDPDALGDVKLRRLDGAVTWKAIE